MKHTTKAFAGKIKFLSLSPHGDPEGIVLEDGSFIKAPPHSLMAKDLFKVGAQVEGKGELLTESPNPVFHHAQIKSGKNILADDSVDKKKREDLKTKHKAELKNRQDAEETKTKFTGKIVAIATKPKGEVDRVIFADGTSVHVPKDVELWQEDCEIGSEMEVKGMSRMYGKARFIKAESVKPL